MGAVADLKEEARETRTKLRKIHKMTASEAQDLTARADAIQRELSTTKTRISTMHASLGTEQCRRLEDLRGSAYLSARVNARVLRDNIRIALQAHKFEREKLERTYRRQIMRTLFESDLRTS